MSAEATGWTWKNSPFDDYGKLLVHLAIADVVNDVYDNRFWMTVSEMAGKARVSDSTVQRTLRELESYEMVELVERGGGRGKPSVYRFLMPENKGSHGDTHSRERVSRTTLKGVTDDIRASLLTQENPREAANKSPRKRNVVWDAIVNGIGWTPSTRSEQSMMGKTVSELKSAWNGDDESLAVEIGRRCDRYRRKYRGLDLTPRALAVHWSSLAAPPVARRGDRHYNPDMD